MNIFIISSPFQLISAIESRIGYFKEKSIFWLHLGGSDKENSFMKKIAAKHLDCEEVIFTPHKNSSYFLFQKILKIKWLKRNFPDARVFIGNIEEFSMKLCCCNLQPSETWLLDDGAKTIVNKDLFDQPFSNIKCLELFNFSNIIKFILVKFFLLKTHCHANLNWFTIYNLNFKNQATVITHDFSSIRKKLLNNPQLEKKREASSKKIYFIGSNLINAGVLQNKSDYFDILKNIKNHYSNFSIHYIPHRFESVENVKYIEEMGFSILNFDNIIEISLLERNIYPEVIASFFSTALYSLNILYPKSQVDFFEVEEKLIAAPHKIKLKAVQKEYITRFKKVDLSKTLDNRGPLA